MLVYLPRHQLPATISEINLGLIKISNSIVPWDIIKPFPSVLYLCQFLSYVLCPQCIPDRILVTENLPCYHKETSIISLFDLDDSSLPGVEVGSICFGQLRHLPQPVSLS